jgi:hypothetical protein
MKTLQTKSGYIIPLTLMLIGLFVFSISYLMQKNTIFSSVTKTMADRERARQLAQGGIQLALSQLATAAEQEKKEDAKPAAGKPDSSADAKQFLKIMLPQLNTLQEFALKKAADGIDGKIGFAVGSEDGKLNLNLVYDFKEHKFINEGKPEGDMKKVMQFIFAQIKESIGADLFADFEKFMKERKYPLNDVSELLTIKGFDAFKDKLFWEPGKEKQKASVYLADLFTVDTMQPGFDLWFLSTSLQTILGFSKPEKLNMEELLKLFKESITLPQDGNTIVKSLYNADFSKIGPSITPVIRTSFEPKLFSVLSYGTIGAVTVRLLALVERERKEGKDATGYNVIIRKIYNI